MSNNKLTPANAEINQNQIIEDFDNYLKIFKTVVASTIKSNHTYIKRFFNWFNKQKFNSLQELQFENLNLFLSHYHSNNTLSSTRKLHYTLRSFFDYCRLQNIIKHDFKPLLPQRRIYSKSFVPAILSPKEVNKLIDYAIQDRSSKGKRNYAMLLLLICYGVRGCQVRNLKLSDIDWKSNTILFKAVKNSNSVEQKLIPEIGNALVDYIINIRPKCNSEKVFLLDSKKELNRASILSLIISKLLDKAGIEIPDNALRGSHIFRHTFASQLLSDGEPIKNISDMLGHRNITTTMIYTKIDIENLRKVCLKWEVNNEK